MAVSPKPKESKLSALLKGKLINLKLAGKNKKEVMEELVELLSASGKIKNKKEVLRAMLERERLGSTGIGNGVAIPHAKSKMVKDFLVAFARTDEGMDFGALDGEKTYVFFALASPAAEVGGHLKILAEISRLVRDKFIVDLLRRAPDKGEILKTIVTQERQASAR